MAQRWGYFFSNHLKLYSNDRYSTPGYETRIFFLWGAFDIPYTNFGQICVNEVKKSDTPVQSRAISYQKSPTKAYMIYSDVLINQPERDKKVFLYFLKK